MKSLFGLFVFLISFLAQANVELVSQVRSFEEENDHIIVTLQDDPRVFRTSKTHSALPCLRNAWLSMMPVALEIDEETEMIKGCLLHSKEHPGSH